METHDDDLTRFEAEGAAPLPSTDEHRVEGRRVTLLPEHVSAQRPPNRTGKLALHPAFQHNLPCFTGGSHCDDEPGGRPDTTVLSVVPGRIEPRDPTLS